MSLYEVTSQGLDVDDLVTGEAVALDLPAASFGLRALSGLIDLAVQAAILTVGLLLTARFTSDQAVTATFVVLTLVLAIVVYPTTMETFLRGRTLGKLAIGIRTVREDGGPVTFDHAYIRALVGFVELWLMFGIPTLISAMVTAKQKRIGDLVAGTYVVRNRVSLTLPRPLSMPHQLAPWAAHADITPLPAALSISIRQLLARSGQLSPTARDTLVRDCAAKVMEHVAPPPPPGTPPELLLVAVQVERSKRDLRRLHAEELLRQRLASTTR